MNSENTNFIPTNIDAGFERLPNGGLICIAELFTGLTIKSKWKYQQEFYGNSTNLHFIYFKHIKVFLNFKFQLDGNTAKEGFR